MFECIIYTALHDSSVAFGKQHQHKITRKHAERAPSEAAYCDGMHDVMTHSFVCTSVLEDAVSSSHHKNLSPSSRPGGCCTAYYYCSAARARHAKSANATTTAITAHGTAVHHDEIAHIHRIVGMWSLG